MGKKSDMRRFRKRRQRAGLVLLASLMLVVLGGFMFSRVDAGGLRVNAVAAADEGPVQRVGAPEVAAAPEAVVDLEARERAEERAAAEKAAEERAAEKAAEERAAQAAAEKKEQEEKAAAQAAAEKKEAAEKKQQAPPQPPVPASQDMWLDVPALGLYDNYVANSNDIAALDAGAAKMEETGFPWQNNANTYISGHRLGYPGTESDHQFYDLPNLGYGDKIYLTDANGTTYTYEVTEFYEVLPTETWITAPVAGRDMISLQTCIEDYGDYWTMGPNWYVRYVVRADRVDWQAA